VAAERDDEEIALSVFSNHFVAIKGAKRPSIYEEGLKGGKMDVVD
jgi:hypothetical protein